MSTRGLGRIDLSSELVEASFVRGDAGGEVASNLMPSFHAGGDGTWNSSLPLSSARLAV